MLPASAAAKAGSTRLRRYAGFRGASSWVGLARCDRATSGGTTAGRREDRAAAAAMGAAPGRHPLRLRPATRAGLGLVLAARGPARAGRQLVFAAHEPSPRPPPGLRPARSDLARPPRRRAAAATRARV